MTKSPEPNWPYVECCSSEDVGECACGKAERYLRYLLNSGKPLTDEQRAWCLSEIERVEGYDRADYEAEPSHVVARGVLNAWTDYCRDKGLM